MIKKKFHPRLYQKIAIEWCMRIKRVAIWAGMGMGKCSIVLETLNRLSLVEQVYPALVIGTVRVAKTAWPLEKEKWLDFDHITLRSLVATNGYDRMCTLEKGADIFTINYEAVPWLIEHFKDNWPFVTVIADESTRLKGFRTRQGTKRARALSKVAWTHVKRWINLTGTPSPNGLKDLWGQTWFQDKGERLGSSYTAFEERWFGYQRMKDAISHRVEIKPVIFPHAQEQIQSRLADICLSIAPEDWFPDLKKPIESPVEIELPEKVWKIYREMDRKFFIEIDRKGIEAVNVGAKMNKLHQLANGAIYLNPEKDDSKEWKEIHDMKLQGVESVMEEAAGMPILVAYTFQTDLIRLKRRFPQGRVLDDDTETVVQWNKGNIPLLFVHPKSGGHGLSLQDGSNRLCYFSSSWNLEEDMQVLERIGPMRQLQSGNNRNVFVHRIVAKRTIDELILRRLETKRSVQDILLDALKDRRTRFTRRDY